MERVNLRLPRETLDRIDEQVDVGIYPTRSEAIRSAIREKFAQEMVA